jgi:hypothetical protein
VTLCNRAVQALLYWRSFTVLSSELKDVKRYLPTYLQPFTGSIPCVSGVCVCLCVGVVCVRVCACVCVYVSE